MNPGITPAEGKNIVERRRSPRFRYNIPICIRAAGAPEVRGMTMEISENGTSLVASSDLKTGDVVELDPVGDGPAKAIVRRRVGKLHGFEFLGLSAEQTAKIKKMCEMLSPYFSNTLDVWKH